MGGAPKPGRGLAIVTLLLLCAATGTVAFIGGPWVSCSMGPALAIATVGVAMMLRQERNARACVHCQYDLGGLGRRGVCPECGRSFDLDQSDRTDS